MGQDASRPVLIGYRGLLPASKLKTFIPNYQCCFIIYQLVAATWTKSNDTYNLEAEISGEIYK